MRIFRHYDDLPPELKGGAVAVGNFDGVHRGHRAVIGEAGKIARMQGAPWGVLTFEPHPRLVFDPDQEPFRLSPFRVKARHVEALGVDYMMVLHFDKAFAQRPAESFVNDVLMGGLGATHVVSGYDFVFGHGRKGNCQMLLGMGEMEGFGFTCVPPVKDASGKPFSSTRARNALLAGDPQGAAGVIGRWFEIEGRVEHGDARGRTIGFPTANVHMGEYLQPAIGVYAVRAGIDEGGETQWIDGVANLGRRPTFDGRDVLLETHLLDYSGDLYGKHLRVALTHYIRGEKKFDGLESLKAQIAEDCQTARELLAKTPYEAPSQEA